MSKQKVYISRHVLFAKSEFSYLTLVNQVSHNVTHATSSFVQSLLPVPITIMFFLSLSPIKLLQLLLHLFGLCLINLLSSPVFMPMPSTTSSHNNVIEDQSITTYTVQSSSSHILTVSEFHLKSLHVILSIPPINLHHMETKSKSGPQIKLSDNLLYMRMGC